ncbi:MAG: pyridoxamine 5'-phosphate oxidase family protein [Chloroflexi bacterium]|nr:pyridoxamine 5'-phosphate oxidase family protein [Chloroflexota bacterium]
MATWAEFAKSAPEMAEVGLKLLERFGLAYLGTVRRDGAPRLHPVCPFIAQGRLFVATNPTSPKRNDLMRDGRYVLHMLPGENDAEFLVRGRASQVTDAETRAMVVEGASQFGDGTLRVEPEELVFEYDIEQAATTYWENVGQPDTRPVRRSWRED